MHVCVLEIVYVRGGGCNHESHCHKSTFRVKVQVGSDKCWSYG